MYKFFANKFTFGVISVLFIGAFAWNSSQSKAVASEDHLFRDLATLVMHGPTMPPDPWDGTIVAAKHGPTMPPDPWDGTIVAAKHGPTMPPDPWDGTIVAA